MKNEVLEYDVYLRVKKEDIHLVTYLLESVDNLMNVRNVVEGNLMKIICPKDTLDESLTLINSLKEMTDLEVVRVEPNNGKV
ncbi:protein of unknown function [Marinitoga hydrogenitolerans DSM 16785]|uniref:DUF4911 domain-containing protein n=1 Tax=Marinitoga hydrogenitolerans (strain DSM 16785 / JCM 12826 / AT1271) TaxID=1122195 RepID=A0A1M4XMV6_MARH1|nr:DUF4911 domain-containing protein [Marinitoga hydrogenitolerans]SHE94750.1 protein of unknown function [Marinitoga hydrogenitolerans DSM 16785]